MRKCITLALFAIALALIGCSSPPTGPNPFTEQNAWTSGVPNDAEIVSPDEFRERLRKGELVIVSTASIAEAAAARETRYDADRAWLASHGDPGPALDALLQEAAGHDDFEGDLPATVAGGHKVVLEGLATRVQNAVVSSEVASDVGNALTDYRQTYALLPANVKAGAPTPESLVGKSLAQVRQALRDLDMALAGHPSLRTARFEQAAVAPLGTERSPAALQPGAGSDQDATWTAPTQLAAQYWYPLKNFVSPIKQQANRGTCWAFTALGAVESRERVQNDNPANLSEQFLVNKVKEDWDSNDYSDGYNADRALNTAVDEGQALLGEGGWTYNPAMNRPSVTDGDADSYARACDPYGSGPNAGTCSETAHQSRRVCSTFIFTVCSYATVTFGGPGVGASNAYQLWASGQSFDLNRYRLMLSQGYVLMASFPVYKGFMDDATNGFVTNYAMTRLDAAGKEVAGSYGGHAVQIVGFIDNAEMSKPGRPPVNIGGGGYFIVKNSWGCGAGDGGYYYVPADYVSRLFNSLSALAFDGRRSAAWNAEQATPGGGEAPVITIRANPARVDLRIQTDLASAFRVTHSVAKSVHLRVTSSTLGTLFDGPWSTDKDALFGPSLLYTFPTQGDQYLSLVARYGTVTNQAILRVVVTNSPPTLELEASGTAYQDEPFTITAKVFDKNEAGVAGLCANTTWSVAAPDTLSSSVGCQVQVTFGATGGRQVQVTTRDTEGLTASRSFNPIVEPPPVNPYPRINGGGVSARDLLFVGGQFVGCYDRSIAEGDTIDVREAGCTLSVIQQPPKRYSATVLVENPAAEALLYDWRLYVTDTTGERAYNTTLGSTSASVELYGTGNYAEATLPCRVHVVVHAPDPSRTKSQTLWTGQCTLYTGQLN